jgi:hypothetical protein
VGGVRRVWSKGFCALRRCLHHSNEDEIIFKDFEVSCSNQCNIRWTLKCIIREEELKTRGDLLEEEGA